VAELILEIVEGTGAGKQVELRDPVEVGRDPASPLSLDDTQASRRHARFSVQNGAAVVEDVGSTNGTFVNNQILHSPRFLNPGDQVRVGVTVIELRSREQVQARPSAAIPVPPVTAVDPGVLQPVPAPARPVAPGPPLPGREGAGGQPLQPGAPAPVLAQPSPAAYVPAEVAGDDQAKEDYEAVWRLADPRVKKQTTIAVFAFLGLAALALVIVFGLIN
jgi:pSer/pThr/pTyr-binding forkhead associated (FHA) protein